MCRQFEKTIAPWQHTYHIWTVRTRSTRVQERTVQESRDDGEDADGADGAALSLSRETLHASA